MTIMYCHVFMAMKRAQLNFYSYTLSLWWFFNVDLLDCEENISFLYQEGVSAVVFQIW